MVVVYDKKSCDDTDESDSNNVTEKDNLQSRIDQQQETGIECPVCTFAYNQISDAECSVCNYTFI